VLQHQGKAAGIGQGMGLAAEPFLTGRIGALAPVAEAVHALGGEADVAHHRDATAHHPVDHRQGLGLGAFELHGGGGGFLQYAPCGSHRLIGVALVAEEGQVGDQQGLLLGPADSRHPPAHGAGVVQHFVEGDGQRGGVAQHHHRQ